MDISLTQRLSFKQAKITVLVAFLLGILFSLAQITLDYAREDAAINHQIQALMKTSHNPAARIAYNIDSELAQELVLGLLRSPAVIRADIIDNNGLTLASVERQAEDSPYRLLSDFMFGQRRTFHDPLYVNHSPKESLGALHLEVDTFAFGQPFLQRSLLTLISGFIRSFILSLILLVLFYSMLTKPLNTVIRSLSNRDLRHDFTPVPMPPKHEHDEIGTLVNVTNQQLANIHQEIRQRRDAEDRLTQYLSELENIVASRTAELKATNARLIQSNQELEQAQRTALDMAQARAAFLATMSHEIRTPLNGLLGMINLTLEGRLSPEQRQQLSVAHSSGKVLVSLLNDVLDMSKFEAGHVELESIPFNLAQLASETAALLSQNAATGVELNCFISPNLPQELIGDPTRIRQIIGNLLSNALKFTRQGRVDLRIEPDAGGVLIEVQDTGIGIAKEAQEQLFKPFTQAGAEITRQYGGTGLGLALTRHFCMAMNCQPKVHSIEGQGSTFSVTLPLTSHTPAPQWAPLKGNVIAMCPANSGLHENLSIWLKHWQLDYQRIDTPEQLLGLSSHILITHDPQQLNLLRDNHSQPLLLISPYSAFISETQADQLQPFAQLPQPLNHVELYQMLQQTLANGSMTTLEPETIATHCTKPIRAMLVEDNLVNQMVARGMLVKLGCEVVIAKHGLEALSYLEEHPVDLVLMDCNMPTLDGYETTRRLRQDPRWQHLPIIALTANALPNERQRCSEAGMNDYLAKPFRIDEIKSLLERWAPHS